MRHALPLLALLAAPLSAQETTTAHGISAFGDLKYPADFAHFDLVNPDAPKGGTLSYRGSLANQTYDSLNLFILEGEPAQGLGRLYDTLLAGAPDEPDSAYGLLAESLEYPADRSWVIFTLRPAARFADGHPVTADDVVFTIETIKRDGNPLYALSLEDVTTATALDDHRVRIDFAPGVPHRDLIAQVGSQPILPRHYYETHTFKKSTMEPPLGSGPYLIENAQPGRSITYCRNPDYWGRDLPVNVGTDNFDCLRYEFYADNTAAFEAFKSGQYTFHEEFFSALWATAYDFPALQKGWVRRETIPDGRPSGAQGFYLNMREPKFQDRRVREALGLMFNFEWSNAQLFYGLYKRTDSFFENSDMEATGLPEGAELAYLEIYRTRLPQTVFTEPAFTPAILPADQQMDRATLRRAGALLDEAGWTVAPDGTRRNAAGEALSIEFTDDGPAFERIVLPYIANLERLGVKASWNLIDSAQLQQRQQDFNFDVQSARLVPTLSPGVELRAIFGSRSADAPGSYNFSGLADPVVDAIIEDIIAATSREEMTTRARALDRVLRDKRIWVPQWGKGSHFIAYWDIFGKPDVKPPYARGDDYWWFDQEKYDALKAQGAMLNGAK